MFKSSLLEYIRVRDSLKGVIINKFINLFF